MKNQTTLNLRCWTDCMSDLSGQPIRLVDMDVISKIIQMGRFKHKYVYVKCRVCGTVRRTLVGSLKRGAGVRCGAACTAILNDGSSKFARMQRIYSGIKERTQNKNNKAFKYYGGKGVGNKFKTFPLFFVLNKDLYDKAEKKYGGDVELDRIDGDGDYSIENTRWVSHSVNMENVDYSYLRKPIIAISPEGEEFRCESQTEFAEQHGLRRPSISACLNGTQETHCGWRFEFDHS